MKILLNLPKNSLRIGRISEKHRLIKVKKVDILYRIYSRFFRFFSVKTLDKADSWAYNNRGVKKITLQ